MRAEDHGEDATLLSDKPFLGLYRILTYAGFVKLLRLDGTEVVRFDWPGLTEGLEWDQLTTHTQNSNMNDIIRAVDADLKSRGMAWADIEEAMAKEQ